MPASTVSVNNWNHWDDSDIYTWKVRFPWGIDYSLYAGWQDAVLAAGERHAIYRADRMDTVGYKRGRDGDFRRFLAARGDRPPVDGRNPPGVVITEDTSDAVVSTLLSYADPVTGAIRSRWVSNLADLAREVGFPEWFHQPPVSLTLVPFFPEDNTVNFVFQVESATDIWFPWNRQEHRWTGQPWQAIDNRDLARLNGPRLNAYLHDVRAASEAIGGSWQPRKWYDRDHPQIDGDGFVILDAPRPPKI
jgi:hypothetical protein